MCDELVDTYMSVTHPLLPNHFGFPSLISFALISPTYVRSYSSFFFFFSSRRRHTRFDCDWSSDVCSSDLLLVLVLVLGLAATIELHLLLSAGPRPPLWLCLLAVGLVLLANWPAHVN